MSDTNKPKNELTYRDVAFIFIIMFLIAMAFYHFGYIQGKDKGFAEGTYYASCVQQECNIDNMLECQFGCHSLALRQRMI